MRSIPGTVTEYKPPRLLEQAQSAARELSTLIGQTLQEMEKYGKTANETYLLLAHLHEPVEALGSAEFEE